ncbi:MAG TPA: hypothetical protein VH253_04260 [Phycisphaerae bacterium]|nr:hypothetical protein [Phycisphaerae bacterium]
MLIDMIHDNHGEPPFKTRYRAAAVLRGYHYQAIVLPEAFAALPAADDGSLAGHPVKAPGQDLEASIGERIAEATADNMAVFFYADALLLPRSQVGKRPGDFLCEDGSGRLCPGKPAVFAALQGQIRELFDRWPAAAGLILRTAEVYPEATPHMMGNPLHTPACPVCRSIALPERLVAFITTVHDVLIGELDKLYIHRAWHPAIPGLANMHDDPEVYRSIASRVPSSPNLAFSFKFTRGDFRQPGPASSVAAAGSVSFNPCLLADARPKWIEFQCEREYEGKGAFPNYQAASWRELLAFLHDAIPAEDFARRFSLWGWSRGGGWGGPYVQREEWIDANVHALGALFVDPGAATSEIAAAWVARTFGVAESAAPTPALVELLERSAGVLRDLLYVDAPVGGGNHTGRSWLKDDLLDVEALWSAAGDIAAIGPHRAEEAVRQKAAALAGVDRLRQLFDIATPELPNKSQARDLANSLACLGSFAGAVVHLFTGFIRFHQWLRYSPSMGMPRESVGLDAADHLEHAQAHWQHHTQRHALLPGAPSVFQENTLWDRTNDCLEQLQAGS